MKLLVVDDSKLARMSIIKQLTQLLPSAEIFEAENGAEAVSQYEVQTPNVVFLDLTMPVMSGYEALEKIVHLNPNAHVIIVTADIQKGAKERVLALGAKSLIQKPIDLEKIEALFSNISLNT